MRRLTSERALAMGTFVRLFGCSLKATTGQVSSLPNHRFLPGRAGNPSNIKGLSTRLTSVERVQGTLERVFHFGRSILRASISLSRMSECSVLAHEVEQFFFRSLHLGYRHFVEIALRTSVDAQ